VHCAEHCGVVSMEVSFAVPSFAARKLPVALPLASWASLSRVRTAPFELCGSAQTIVPPPVRRTSMRVPGATVTVRPASASVRVSVAGAGRHGTDVGEPLVEDEVAAPQVGGGHVRVAVDIVVPAVLHGGGQAGMGFGVEAREVALRHGDGQDGADAGVAVEVAVPVVAPVAALQGGGAGHIGISVVLEVVAVPLIGCMHPGGHGIGVPGQTGRQGVIAPFQPLPGVPQGAGIIGPPGLGDGLGDALGVQPPGRHPFGAQPPRLARPFQPAGTVEAVQPARPPVRSRPAADPSDDAPPPPIRLDATAPVGCSEIAG
jgi:hypothetical protein